MAELLIANGANINVKDDGKFTPLHDAARRGNTTIVKLLMTNGANVNAKTRQGWTALDYARAASYKDIVELLSKIQP